jgi:hypothetical protein
MWGLFGIKTNPNGSVGWTEYCYMYNPDQLLERPTVGALKAYWLVGYCKTSSDSCKYPYLAAKYLNQ